MHKYDSEFWNIIVQDAIRANTLVDPEGGCFEWIGETSRYWGYPVVRPEGHLINVRSGTPRRDDQRPGHVSFFRETCGNRRCARIAHLELMEIVPTDKVRAMERR